MATTYSDSIAKFGRHVFGDAATYPIRKIELSDLGEALRLGWEDFKAMPSHAVVVCVIYPVLGIALFRMVLGYSVLPLLFPLAAGFALLGPFAAIGLYELSRRRERGEEVDVSKALHVLRAPAFGAMVELGVLLLVLFGVLDRRSERNLRLNLWPRTGCEHPRFCNARADDAGRMVAHHRRLRRWFSVRGRGAVRQRRVVSVDARPACHCD